MSSPTRRDVLALAVPVMVANSAVPILGLIDTAVIGRSGDATALGAIALGALIFNFVYWGFGFLRMGTSGFTARASGAGDALEVRATFLRALLTGLTIGIALIALRWPVEAIALSLLEGSDEVNRGTSAYLRVRIWGAPATLGTFSIFGALVGLGRTRELMVLQLLLNGLNAALDVAFVVGLGMGVRGVALGTVLAEWIVLALGLRVMFALLRPSAGDPRLTRRVLFDRERWLGALRANTDILVRTLFLLAGFAWFTRESARFGDVALAANHILLQLISFSAFVLDGYAFVVEALVGHAIGARDRRRFVGALRRSTELAGISALVLALTIHLAAPIVLDALTTHHAVRAEARAFLPYATIYIVCSFIAFQLDGVFIGATATRPMRNTAIVSFSIFVVAAHMLLPSMGLDGLWIAFILYVVARGVSLGLALPGLFARSVSND
jgi:multidrug resistance protein, MATE family